MNFRMAAFFSAVLCLASMPRFAAAETIIASELSPEIAKDYIHAHTFIDVGGGRKMNLDCRGEGPVTVIFDSGLSDWSSIWALVQPQTAIRTRACTYDRAGMGYSDLSDRPGTPSNIVDDLRNLIKAAGIQGPVVLVGHSLGGFNMKLFAASYPSEVAVWSWSIHRKSEWRRGDVRRSPPNSERKRLKKCFRKTMEPQNGWLISRIARRPPNSRIWIHFPTCIKNAPILCIYVWVLY